jgi:hypothetical protein
MKLQSHRYANNMRNGARIYLWYILPNHVRHRSDGPAFISVLDNLITSSTYWFYNQMGPLS